MIFFEISLSFSPYFKPDFSGDLCKYDHESVLTIIAYPSTNIVQTSRECTTNEYHNNTNCTDDQATITTLLLHTNFR